MAKHSYEVALGRPGQAGKKLLKERLFNFSIITMFFMFTMFIFGLLLEMTSVTKTMGIVSFVMVMIPLFWLISLVRKMSNK